MAKARTAPKTAAPIKRDFWSNHRSVGIVLGVFAFVLYAQTIGFGYALDDVAVIHGNDFVKDGFKGFKDILTTFYWHGNAAFANSNSGLFRPLSLLLFATEWQIFGDKPAAFHFVHVVLYAVLSMQLYLLMQSLFGKQYGKLALIATVLWIVMPIHTEVVANLKSADEILALLFSVLGLRWLLKWDNDPKITTLLIASVFFFLSLLSKEAAVLVLPLGLLMLYMFRGRKMSELIMPGAILFGFALVWLMWHYLVISNATAPRISYDYRHNALLSSASGIDQLGTAIGLQARYWYKMTVGYPLSYNYSFNEIPVDGFAGIWAWIAIAGIGAAVYFAWKNFRTNPAVSFAIIFYFITMLLTSNIFFRIGDIFAERFAFVPSVGFCVLTAYLIQRFTKSESALSSTAIGILVVACGVYSIRTLVRSSEWKSETELFLADVDHSPNSARVHDNAGVIYLNSALTSQNEIEKKSLFDQAFDAFSRAYEIDPRDFSAAQALGQIMYHKGDFQASVRWSRISVEQRRTLTDESGYVVDDPTTFLNMGDAFVKMERYDSANYYYTQAVRIIPAATTEMKIGDASLRAKDTLAAIAAYERSVQLDSAYVAGWDKIANLKGMRGDYQGSNEAFRKIAALNPLDPNPWKMLYTNYSLMGDSAQMNIAAQEYYNRGGR